MFFQVSWSLTTSDFMQKEKSLTMVDKYDSTDSACKSLFSKYVLTTLFLQIIL